jgi:hypothetical protein
MGHGRINGRIGDSKGITTRLTPRHDRSDSAVVENKRSGKELIILLNVETIRSYAIHCIKS